jgi:hypothetical protein
MTATFSDIFFPGNFWSVAAGQCLVLGLAGGKITEIRGVSDRLGMFMQLGWGAA